MKAKYIFILSLFCLFTYYGCSEEQEGTYVSEIVSDIDGNTYTTIKIGNQIWLAENLKTTRLNDGSPITEFNNDSDNDQWSDDENLTPFYQWSDTRDSNDLYQNDLPVDFYGAMYNEAAISSGKLAPEGYRIPTLNDYLALFNYLSEQGYAYYEAQALKSATGWIKNIGNGNNAFYFNALPNGYVHENGEISATEGVATLATSSFQTDGSQIIIQLSGQNEVQFINSGIVSGAGVRCIKE